MRENYTFEGKMTLVRSNVSMYISLSTNASILLAACGHSCGNYGHCGCEGICDCDIGYHVSDNSQECVPGMFSWFISLLGQTHYRPQQ